MSRVLEHTTEGQEILARGLARGLAEGEARVLRALLAEKFGESDDLDAVARSLAEQDVAEGLRRIREAATLDDLAS